MTRGDVDPGGAGAAADVRAAMRALEDARAAVADHGGRERLDAAASAVADAEAKLNQYEERATGTGDFQAYVEFQEAFATFVEALDDDLPERDAFERALDAVEKRRLSESDFEAARAALSPARDLAAVRERLVEAREELTDARRRARDRLSAVEDGIAARERLLELGDADLDAPVDELREPIAAYDDAVREAFAAFRREHPAREVLNALSSASEYPLVDVEKPPADLLAYVRERDAGEHSIPDLLEYAEYSSSKLEHYVDDASALRSAVATNQTYLDRLDGVAFTVGWPPPTADTLKYETRELLSVVSGFAPDDVATALRAVRELAWREDYERLRTAAVALDELGSAERDRLASGAVDDELAALCEERDDLEAALADAADVA
jgi:hypothetical protein